MSNSQKSKPKRPILVIEDDPAQLKMLANILRSEGLRPVCCQTGQEALQALENEAVNVAILDLHLPDIDGMELLKQLKAHNPQLKVIINTGYPSLDSAMAAVNHEAFAYVKKMDDVGGLLAHVHRAFHEHLADHNEILAAEVKRRTEDLLKANQELKREIFERKQIEAALRESEGRYRSLFENSPISLLELDLSEIKADLEKLQSQGASDFSTYFKEHPEIIVQYMGMVKPIDINQAALALYQASDLDELNSDFNRIFIEESYITFAEELVAIAEGKTRFETETIHQTLRGGKKHIALRWSVPAGYEQTFSKVLVSIVDVTKQKKAEQILMRRAQEMETLYETSLEISIQPDLPALLQEIVQRAASLLSTRGGALFLFDVDEGILKLVAGHNHPFPRPDQMLQVGQGLTGQIAQTGEPRVLTDYQQWDERLTFLQEPVGRILGVPLKRGDRVIGVLNVFDRDPGVFGDEIRLLNSFAAQAAIAIENTRLFEAEREQRLLAETLAEVTLALTSQTSNSAVLDEILHQVQRLVSYRTANIMLLDGEVLYVAGWQGYEIGEGEELISGLVQPLNEFPIEAQIVQSGQPYVIPNTQEEPRWILLDETAWIKSNLSVPICWYDRVLGILRLDSHIPAEFSEADAERLKPLANAAAIALENARLYGQARQEIAERKQAEKSLARRAAEMAALYETWLEINAQLDLTTLLQTIVKRASTLLGTQMGGVFLLQPDGETLELVVCHNQPDQFLGIRLKLGEGLAGRIAQTGEPMTVSDYYHWSERADVSSVPIIGRMLGVPLTQGEQIIGVINVSDEKPGEFDREQTRLLSLFAVQASTAIANARLFNETFRRAQQLAVLNELAREMTGVVDAQELCDTVVQRMTSNFDYLNVGVMTVDPGTQELVLQAIAGEYAEKIQPGQYRQPIGQGVIGQAVATGETILVDDRHPHQDFYTLPQTKVRSELAIPLTIGSHTIGVLVVSSEYHETFDKDDIAAITTVADQLAIALEKVRLFDETRRRAEQLEALHQISQDLSVLQDLETLFSQIVQRAIRLLGGDTGGIFLYRPERDLLEWVVATGDGVPAPGLTLSRGEGVSGKIWETGESLAVEDYQQWPGKSPKLPGSLPTTALIGVPIQWGDEFLGVLIQGNRNRRHYTAEDAKLMSQFANQVAIAIRNANFYAESQRRLKEQTALRKASEVISSTLDLQTVLDHMAEQLTLTVDATSAYICSLDLDTMTYTVLAEYIGAEACPEESVSDLGVIYDLQQNFQTDMNLLRFGQFKIAHRDDDDLTEAGQEHFRRFGAQSILFLPMQIGGRTIAFAELWESRHRREFTSEDIALCQAIAQQAAIAMDNARLHQKTEKQARQVERILNTVRDGILLLDAEHFIKLANPAAQTYLRLLADIGVGEVLTHIGERPLHHILDSRNGGYWHEISIEDDQQALFEVAAQPVQMGPETEGWVIILRDVTEERQIQEQIQQQDRLAAVGQLAAGIAHDFNNILTSMIGYAELIRLDPAISGGMSKDLGLIIQQGERAAYLIRQILDFSRRSIIEKRPMDLSVFLKEVVKLLERTIPEAIRIRLLIDADPEVYLLRADPGQIQQALTNLAVNARDAMPDGGELKFWLSHLKLDAEDHSHYPDLTSAEWLVLSIADTGTGIKPEYLNHIFEPFFTTKDVGQGTGLGLAQVYGIIKQHDGHITVESQPGLGTTFTLYFPALPTLAQPSFPRMPVEVPHGQGEVILLVEDDAVVLEVTESMLQTLGYQVLIATNGREALEVFDRHQDEIALVLTDVTMPELGGIALAQALQERSSTIKIVALTGYPLEIEAEHSLTKGIVDWLQKPLNLKQLAKIVNRSLN